jgi:hypothetical protein
LKQKQPKRRRRKPGRECCAQAEISAPTEDEATKLIEQNTSGKGRGKQELLQILLPMGLTEQQIDLVFTRLLQAGRITVDDVGTVFWKGT